MAKQPTAAHLPRQSGVYCIMQLSTGRRYIGSSLNIRYRWLKHRKQLTAACHHNKYLQAAWQKYGEQDFVCNVLDVTTPDQRLIREQYWINQYNTCSDGFNFWPAVETQPEVGREAGKADTRATLYALRDPSGQTYETTELVRFCREHALTRSAIIRVANGKASHHKGWSCWRPVVSNAWAARGAPPPRVVVMRNGKKRCSACRDYLVVTEFQRDKSTKTGLAAYCRRCNRKRASDGYRRHQSQRLAAAAVYRDNNRERMRQRAKQRYQRKRQEQK